MEWPKVSRAQTTFCHFLHRTLKIFARIFYAFYIFTIKFSRLGLTAICVLAQTANIFARLFTFETGRLPLETECFTAHVTCYSAEPNSVIFHVLMCFRVQTSVFPSSQYCKSDQTCLYSYFLWLERIIMGLEILKRARRHIKTWQLRQK
jgi:hypothetical protein